MRYETIIGVHRLSIMSSEGPWATGPGPMGPGPWDHGTGTMRPRPWDHGTGPVGPGPWDYGTGSMGPGPWDHGMYMVPLVTYIYIYIYIYCEGSLRYTWVPWRAGPWPLWTQTVYGYDFLWSHINMKSMGIVIPRGYGYGYIWFGIPWHIQL